MKKIQEKEATEMNLDLSAILSIFEGFDVMALVNTIVEAITGLLGGLVG